MRRHPACPRSRGTPPAARCAGMPGQILTAALWGSVVAARHGWCVPSQCSLIAPEWFGDHFVDARYHYLRGLEPALRLDLLRTDHRAGIADLDHQLPNGL